MNSFHGEKSINAGSEAELLPANAERIGLEIQVADRAFFRVTLDGSEPTATHGIALFPGQTKTWGNSPEEASAGGGMPASYETPTGPVRAFFVENRGPTAQVDWTYYELE